MTQAIERKLLDEVKLLEQAIGKLDYNSMRKHASTINLMSDNGLDTNAIILKENIVRRTNDILVSFADQKPLMSLV